MWQGYGLSSRVHIPYVPGRRKACPHSRIVPILSPGPAESAAPSHRGDSMAVDVRVFCGVDVVIDGRVVDLGHARQRCVLAVLVANANQSVSADHLVDHVWGETPPPRGRDAIYTYVSRLRVALAAAPDVLIQHDANGYRLTVDDSTIDLYRFRSLIAQARASTDDRVALTLLDQAVTLAHGEPFAGLNSPWLVDLRTAVTAERYAAELDRTDLALRYRRHDGLITDLSIRVAEHPLDERLAGQLLLALYRTGRQADAITHYQRVRATLAGELGSRPGPALQAIYHQILTGDDQSSSPASSGPIPRQLPAGPAWFTGREPELAALTRIVDTITPAGRTVVISAIAGTGGIGKTWLALRWAYRHLDQFPDGQLFVDLHGFAPSGEPMTPDSAVRGFLDALGISSDRIPVDLDAQTALYRSTIAGRRMLIVLDNAADATQVTPLLPCSQTCTVLITSRRQLPDLAAVHHVPLGVLTETEAHDLLCTRLGADRIAAEAEAVETLLACCGGFPLALSIMIGRALAHPDFPLSVLAAELGDDTRALEALDTGDPAASLPAVLSWSLRALTSEQIRVFGLLGIAPGPDISLPAAASLTALSTGQTQAVLQELENASLLQQHTPGRYRMHDLIRRYATDIAEDVRDEALRRVLDFYVHTAHAADRLLAPHRPLIHFDPPIPCVHPHPLPAGPAALAWFDAEHPNLLAAQHTAAGHALHSTVWQLTWTMDVFHHRRGRRDDQLAAALAGLDAAAHLPDPTTLMLAHQLVGSAYADLERYEEGIGYLHQALALAEKHDDIVQQARTHRGLSHAWEQRGDDRQALAHATSDLALQRVLDLPAQEAIALNQVGWFAARLGDYDTARRHCQDSLTLHRQNDNPSGEAAAGDSLGYIAYRTGNHQEAIRHYQHVLTVLDALGNTFQTAGVLDAIGQPYVALGEYEQARAAWREALRLYQEQGRDTDAERIRQQLSAASF